MDYKKKDKEPQPSLGWYRVTLSNGLTCNAYFQGILWQHPYYREAQVVELRQMTAAERREAKLLRAPQPVLKPGRNASSL